MYEETAKGPEPRLRGVGSWMHNNNSSMGNTSTNGPKFQQRDQSVPDTQPAANFLRKRGSS